MGFYDCILNVADPNGPGNDSTPEDEYREPNIDAQIVAIVVVSAVVFMAAVLPCLIWSLFGVKGNFSL